MLGFFSTAAVNREVVFKVELGVVVFVFFKGKATETDISWCEN